MAASRDLGSRLAECRILFRFQSPPDLYLIQRGRKQTRQTHRVVVGSVVVVIESCNPWERRAVLGQKMQFFSDGPVMLQGVCFYDIKGRRILIEKFGPLDIAP